MKISILMSYAAGHVGATREIAEMEKAGLDATSLVGSDGFVRDRLQVLRECGVTSLNVAFLGSTTEERVKNCDALRNLLEKI